MSRVPSTLPYGHTPPHQPVSSDWLRCSEVHDKESSIVSHDPLAELRGVGLGGVWQALSGHECPPVDESSHEMPRYLMTWPRYHMTWPRYHMTQPMTWARYHMT